MVWDVLLILLILLILILAGLLFVPLSLNVNTLTDTYRVRARGLFSFRMAGENEELIFILKGPFFKKVFYPFREKKVRAEQEHPGKKQVKKKSRKPGMTPDKFLALLRSFRVHEFYCTLDTGDYTRNALMIPVFQVMTHYRNNLSVNFTGEFQLRFLASNNLWRLGRAWLTA